VEQAAAPNEGVSDGAGDRIAAVASGG
jgi:hypothetical protein